MLINNTVHNEVYAIALYSHPPSAYEAPSWEAEAVWSPLPFPSYQGAQALSWVPFLFEMKICFPTPVRKGIGKGLASSFQSHLCTGALGATSPLHDFCLQGCVSKYKK